MAKLYFRYGAMGAGKTTLLLQTAFNYEEKQLKVLLLKPVIDTKGKEHLVSRLGLERKVDYLIKEQDDIFSLLAQKKDISCILVDEAQFLTKKQVDELLQVVVLLGIPVICYGLRTDFRGEGFPGAERLLLIAHSIEEMKTICRCGKKAIFNARKVNGEFVFLGDQVEIDDKDTVDYEPLCAECYFTERRSTTAGDFETDTPKPEIGSWDS